MKYSDCIIFEASTFRCKFPKEAQCAQIAVLILPTIVTTGSNSLSPSTDVQLISIAPGAPGEHGVNKSSTMTLGSLRDGPLTWMKENFAIYAFHIISTSKG